MQTFGAGTMAIGTISGGASAIKAEAEPLEIPGRNGDRPAPEAYPPIEAIENARQVVFGVSSRGAAPAFTASVADIADPTNDFNFGSVFVGPTVDSRRHIHFFRCR